MAAVVAVAAAPVAAADALVVVADDVIEKEFFVWIEFKSIFLKLIFCNFDDKWIALKISYNIFRVDCNCQMIY